ncbi:CheW protein [Oleidesulfovibrio alaskensis G20]|jgi:purine-binding chemotaxis protein CheW|uniref:CheW protein n=1 Tax=Oleidesulfovibrio alaskensis (strain ATCC BAA-1058 / DSM 17464 / G20) TaxID=207559 RepID=Q315M0_OLEA2|nr:chemotaxis protein CheW [Oleidesulfovibrio alaskensis]ABB37376.1 CheW protein [Oleidesulfovibrio alaskensis G20]MBG0774248.1 chemotaxis protein CheW [Oleidesulfovibrio alaskensis]MBL3583146.1 chemotaxis protein CheW [Oleidesulfovibrio alaskensis]
MTEDTTAQCSQCSQYFTFVLDNELFALEIDSIREVLELPHITRIPRTPAFMRGVINLRGHAVPVVDLRRKFAMPAVQDTVDTCIIIVEVMMDGELSIIGALADGVREVVDISPDAVEPAPRMGTAIQPEYIRGITRHDNAFVMLLDAERLFSQAEMEMPPAAPL